MSDLTQRAEQAATREEAVAVFCGAGEYWLETGRAYHADFDRHIAQAIHSKSATRALGYLLLAAMAVVPEGWDLGIGTVEGEPRGDIMRPATEEDHKRFGQSLGAKGWVAHSSKAHYLCTALLSAILKTEATNG